MAVITLMGPMGAGKTMQAQRLADKYGLVTFSTGQLLRDAGNDEMHTAQASGKLAPTELVQDMVLDKIRSIDVGQTIVLDGSPRMLPEAERLNRDLPAMGRKLDLVIFIDIDEPTVQERLSKRGRADDQPDVAHVRWQEYQRDTMPVVEQFRKLGLVREVVGHGTPEEVGERIDGALHDAGII